MISAILLSGGLGKRMEAEIPKQYIPLLGLPIVLHSLKALLSFPSWHEIVVVCEKEYEPLFINEKPPIPLHFARPGKLRQDSVLSGLQKLSPQNKWVCIHDGARPNLTPQDLLSVILSGKEHGAATLATPLKQTVKKADSELFVKKTLDRSFLWEIQTPQILQYSWMIQGFKKVEKEKLLVTDDVSLAECLNLPVKLVQGSYKNIKITTPEDFALVKLLMESNANL